MTDDRVELRALVDAYSAAADRRDADAFAALFTDDAVLATFAPDGTQMHERTGVAEIGRVPETLRRYDRTFHLVGTHVVEVDGDEATGEAWCVAHHLTTGEAGAMDRVLAIRYADRYRRSAGGWRFAFRHVRIQFSENRPVRLDA